jgi:2'-5' RNA ligase
LQRRQAPAIASGEVTLRNVRRDFPEWHLGRPRYALWALQVDVAPVTQRLQAAQQHLADLLLERYHRQAHVTVSLCGFPCDAPQHADDFGPAALRAQLAALRQAQPRPFEIDIGALASFTSVPYLTVDDAGGHLAALRDCLAHGEVNPPGGRYTPHVTVGLYAGAWPMPSVQARLESFVCDAPLRLHIDGISLMSYAAPEIGERLSPIAHYDFASGTLRWDEPGPDAPLGPTQLITPENIAA